MNTTDRYAKIMGPTPGLRVIQQDQVQSGTEWHMLTGETHYRVLANVPVASDRDRADAAFLAACDPDTIRELLAERDALAAENERLRQTLKSEIEKAVQKWGDLRNDDATRRGVAFAADILRAALKEADDERA